MSIQKNPQSTVTAQQALQLMRSDAVLVAGVGVAGRGIIAMLCALRGVEDPSDISNLSIADDRSDLATTNVADAIDNIRAGGSGAPALVVTSPGWQPTSPLLVAAAELGIPVIGDVEAAWLVDQAGGFGPARTWLAITGTNGKTTTTAMLASMLVADGQGAAAVGNIGVSPAVALTAELRGEPRADVLVAEVSSFQLHWAPTFTPTVGCVLNIAEDHLDWHGSLAGYAHDKAAVLRAEHPVIAVDDAAVTELPHRQAPLTAFSTADPYQIDADRFYRRVGVVSDQHDGPRIVEVIEDGSGQHEKIDIASAEDISPPGPAGVADATAAAAMARCVGVSTTAIAEALGKFTVQAHRGQVVLKDNDVVWIDNSKATNPHAAQAALQGQSNVIWIAGGQLKGASVQELLANVKDSLSAVIALGADRKDIVGEVGRQCPDLPCVSVTSTDPRIAMAEVARIAHGLAQPGDTVMLAPAAASLDMFTGMGQRGDLFAEMAVAIAANTRPASSHTSTTPPQED